MSTSDYDPPMDEAISFLRQFLDALYRMSHAKLSEPDDMKFISLVRAADAFFDGKDLAESSGQCITTTSQQLFEFLRRRFPSQRFSWPPIELIGDLVQVKLIVR